MRRFRDYLFSHPISVMGMILSVQTILYGVGYLIPTLGFQETVLYEEMGTLIDQRIAGILFIFIGLLMIFSILRGMVKLVVASFQLDAFIWLFALFVYVLNGTPVLGTAIGGTFSVLSGYISFAYVNAQANNRLTSG